MKRAIALLCILFFFLCGISPVFAANEVRKDSVANIIGIVKDGDRKTFSARRGRDFAPLYNAIVTLYFRQKDKIDSVSTITGWDGKFSFRNIKPQRIGLQVRRMGYQSESGVYDIGVGENAFYFTLNVKTEELKEATVVAEIPLVKQIQDTTIFNTQAIRTMEDENLKAALESLPGFEVSDDGVKVNGVPVSKTYVNGKLIFGNSTMTAVNLLKAKDVTQVKVFDQQTAVDKHRGMKNSDKERVMDVITKDKFLSFFSVGAGAAGGIDETRQERYFASAAARFDSEKLEISAGATGSNLGSAGKASFRVGAGPMMATSIPSPAHLGDYGEQENVDVGFRKHWKDREFGNSLSANYQMTHNYNRSASMALNEYFANLDTPHMIEADTTSSSSSSFTHILMVNTDLKDTKLKSFTAGLTGTFTTNNSNGFNGSAKKTDGMPDELRHESTGADSRDYSLAAILSWTNNDPVKWRPIVDASFGYSKNDRLSWTVDTMATSFVRRQLKSDGWGRSMNAYLSVSASGVLVNNEKRTVNSAFGARGWYDNGKSRQMTTNEWDVPSPITDLANSYDYTHHDISSEIFWNVSYSDNRKRNMAFNISAKDVFLVDNERFPADYNTNMNYILPEFSLMCKWDTKVDFRLDGNMSTPAIEQVRNRISDSNPMILTGGNPNLKCSYNFSASGRYSPVTVRNPNGYSHSLDMVASADCGLGRIVNQSKYFSEKTKLDEWDGYVAPAGSMLYTFTNSSIPAWHAGIDASYYGNTKGNKFGFRLSLDLGYSRQPQYAAQELIQIGDAIVGGKVSLFYRPSRKFRLQADFLPSYIESRNDNGNVLSNRFIMNSMSTLTWYPLKWMAISSQYNFNIYKYVSGAGVDHDVHNLSASIVFFPKKDRSLKIALSGNDLLNSGSTYVSSITASSMNQTWRPTYGRYYLLSVTYLFRHKK